MKTKVPIKELDYVELYAESIKDNPSFFEQQKLLIESQMSASNSIFKNNFKNEKFKEKAREYLRKIGLLRP